MARPHVEVVLINWKRPANVGRIVEAFRRQTVPCTITVCDCHPTCEFALDEAVLARVDRLYRWEHNLGAYSRYAPSAGYDHEYTYLSDDDILPGSACLEHYLDHANGRRFGVLGQFGRRLKPDLIYRTRRVPRTDRLEEVDLVVQAYFVRTRHLGHVATVRWELGQERVERTEDDILLAVAMQVKVGLGSFLTPRSDDPETSSAVEELPSPYSLSRRQDHLDQRTALFAEAHRIGWRPRGVRRETALVWAARRRLLVAEQHFRRWRRSRGDENL